MTTRDPTRKVVASNRRARRDFEIIDSYECGIVLLGSEVKSLRASQVQLKDAYAEMTDGELWLENMHISPYSFARGGGHQPERPRKLLLHKRELDRLIGMVNERGLTLIPLSVYFTRGLAKVELALVRGRRQYDKRHKLRERDQRREIDRARSRR
ncbi:MAG: SsrA-binding protein SmpB [Acidimicrobiia bacterium]